MNKFANLTSSGLIDSDAVHFVSSRPEICQSSEWSSVESENRIFFLLWSCWLAFHLSYQSCFCDLFLHMQYNCKRQAIVKVLSPMLLIMLWPAAFIVGFDICNKTPVPCSTSWFDCLHLICLLFSGSSRSIASCQTFTPYACFVGLPFCIVDKEVYLWTASISLFDILASGIGLP